jgi:hypothetical protein
MRVAQRKVGENIDLFRAILATCRFACLRGRRWYHEKQLRSPLHCRAGQNLIHPRCLLISIVLPDGGTERTYGHQPRCFHLAGVERGEHHRYLYILHRQHRPETNGWDLPGGSILQIKRSLKSSRSRQITLSSALGGTTQLSPSTGKHSSIAFPNGL